METIIPKKVHYIWFGYNPKSDFVLKCIDSWKKYLPDYEIIEWNEENYDVTKNAFMKEAYENKKWAFASDYARFDILNEYGGIYLDTDVEFLKPLPAEMLCHKGFTGYESTGQVSPGLIYAAVPHFSITEEILSEYKHMRFLENGKHILKTVNMLSTEVIERHCKLERNVYQVVDGMVLYPSSFFCGYDLDVMEYDIRPETISVHHYAGTWMQKTMKRKVQKILKTLIGIKVYRKLLWVKRKLLRVLN